MPTKGKSVGPGGRSTPMKSYPYKSHGPGGPANSNVSTTTNRGYEKGRTEGLRTNYKQTANGANSMAGRSNSPFNSSTT
ncbi:hypothetical protein [Paenibacillus qinlingensis]|uniref:Uncharacterized protein n=1 Tax=Paenibacillus qinlingensis TaxID=1837343 RepID=A0ABU1P6Y2_9BACL|nr:hypothetical protein [Paenibacillus qinlingensis]MDR6555443.1 hypothetical protein [Paenibacillus qinlingensis]